MTLNTTTAYIQKQYYRLWWGAVDEWQMSHSTYIHIMVQRIMKYAIEIYMVYIYNFYILIDIIPCIVLH